MVPRHQLYGSKTSEGLLEKNDARAAVYGYENRNPLSIPQFTKIHEDELRDHFSKPIDEQISEIGRAHV